MTYISWCTEAACPCWERTSPILHVSTSTSIYSVNFETYNHLTILRHLDTLALDNLNIVQAAQNLVLHLESGRHGELGALLDLEGLVLEGRLGAGGRKVDRYGWTAGRVHGEAVDDADALVVGV